MVSAVRKSCARWDTGPNPGAFLSGQIDPAMVPGANENCAIEAVFFHSGTPGWIIEMEDAVASSNIVSFYQTTTWIKGSITTAGSGGPQVVFYTPTPNQEWYHVKVEWQDSGAGTARIEMFVNGASVGVTPYYAKNPWLGGVASYLRLGGQRFGWPYLGGRLALARYFKGASPLASYLYNVPYLIPAVTPTLQCQWDMRPGSGNTAIDTTGLFDIPWVAVNQANALYSTYRYTGQCRAGLWIPP